MPEIMTPIAGRECGGCTACCVVPTIDKPEIQKKSGTTCRHCVDHACVIYETRPQVCRDYYCGWRRLKIFGDDWRPDISGVYVELDAKDIPSHLPPSTGITLMLIGNPLKTVREPWFIDFVAHGIRQDVPLFLKLPGPPGFQGVKANLNTGEMTAAARSKRGEVKSLLETALRKLASYRFREHVPVHTGNDVSA